MPDKEETRPLDPVQPYPPGFSELPVEEQMLIQQFRANPEMGTVYVMTKVAQIRDHQKTFGEECKVRHKVVDKRLRGHDKFKWLLTGGITILGAMWGWVISKVSGA